MFHIYHCHLYSGLVTRGDTIWGLPSFISPLPLWAICGTLGLRCVPSLATEDGHLHVWSRGEEMVLQLVNPVFFFRLITSLKSPVLRGREPRSLAAWTHLGLGLILVCSMERHQHSLWGLQRENTWSRACPTAWGGVGGSRRFKASAFRGYRNSH